MYFNGFVDGDIIKMIFGYNCCYDCYDIVDFLNRNTFITINSSYCSENTKLFFFVKIGNNKDN